VCGTEGPADASPGAVGTPAIEAGLRVVVVGKGGVGKSTLTALLARVLARGGSSVVAVDADAQRNLGVTLGLSPAQVAAVTPVAAAADYVEEKTGARPGEGAGAMLRLNPDTADVVDRLAATGPDGVRLLVMGGVQRSGGGCLCPENALLAAAVAGMRLRQGDVVLMDTHAGVEHFGRSLARGFDTVLVVVDPTYNAVQVGVETARLAADLGIDDIRLVVNRVRSDVDVDRALSLVETVDGGPARGPGRPAFSSVHGIPFDPRVMEVEPSVNALLAGSPFTEAVGRLAVELRARRPSVQTVVGSPR
jgi:CO dehydrogenase maturation factor